MFILNIDFENIGTSSISEDAPTGVNVRYEPEFDSLDSEIQKLGGVNTIDWKHVVEQSGMILKNHSKDMLILSYMCYGLYKIEGFAGLKKGLGCYYDMVEKYWDTLYPVKKKMRGRISSVEWLSEKLGDLIKGSEVKKGQEDDCFACMEKVVQLDIYLDKQFGGNSSAMLALSRALKTVVDSIPDEVATKEEKKSAPAKQVLKPSAASGLSYSDITSKNDAISFIMETQKAIRKVLPIIRKEEPVNPLQYRYKWFLSWVNIAQLPPNKNSKLLIPSPPTFVVNSISNLFAASNWEALIVESDTHMNTAPLWLDLAVYTIIGLEELGGNYEPAKDAVKAEFKMLIYRFPELADFSFSNGVGLLTDENRQWVEDNIFVKNGEQADSADSDKLSAVVKKARSLIKSKKTAKAMELFKQELPVLKTGSERMTWKLELAKLCLAGGELKTAVGMLAALAEKVTMYNLSEWEPELAFDVLKQLYLTNKRFLPTSTNKPELLSEIDGLYAKMSKIDFVRAYETEGKK